MVDLISYLSMILFVVPIAMGAGAWATQWLAEHFYQEPFYSDEEYGQT